MTAEPEFDSEEQRLLCHLYATLNKIPCCGCGNPEDAHRLIHQILSLAPLHTDDSWQKARELIGSDGAFQIVLSALNDANLMEHGTTVGGSWLTDRGKWFLWAVEQVGGIGTLTDKLDGVGFPHDWDYEAQDVRPCVDACWTITAQAAS